MSEPVAWRVAEYGPPDLDSAEMPCVDCFVGEPHMCPLLGWVPLYLDEWGGITEVPPADQPGEDASPLGPDQ